MPITSPGNDDDTGENHQPTLRKNTAEPVEQTLKQNTDGLPLEVVVADTSRGPALIHAMRMRTQYVKLLEGGRQWT